MRMLPAVILGVICGITVVIVFIVVCVICRIYRKRQHHRKCIPPCGYDAVGDYKPPSLMSVSTTSQDIQLTKEQRAIQPRSTSITSRTSVSTYTSHGSMRSRSDTVTEETSSISAKSDTSVDSYIFDPSFGAIRPDLYPRKDAVLQQESLDQNLGRLHIRLKYDYRTSDLIVHLIEAQEIASCEPRDHDSGFGDPYVRITMLPEVDERIRQSSVKRKTCNPFYNEYFKFPVTYDEIKEKSIAFYIYDYDKFSRHKIIGEVVVDLAKIDTSNSVEMWCDILRHLKQETTGDNGEVLLSLSYLPTAERLTVVVMKAKDLRMPEASGTNDPYVRISLIMEGRKIKRKKTSVKRGTNSPVWNEALAFNVPSDALEKACIEVNVFNHDLIGHGASVGRCMLGHKREGAEGKHWNDMVSNHRKSMAMWQVLHKR